MGWLPNLSTQTLQFACGFLAYMCFSVTITMYNKWAFVYYGFHFPLTLVSLTFAFNWVFAAVIRQGMKHDYFTRLGHYQTVTLSTFLRFLLPIGLLTAAEISFSNLSLLSLSVSFHTMVKSSTPVFVLVASVLLGLQEPRRVLLGIVVLICTGVAILSEGSGTFALSGFLFILFAAVASGGRWAMSQLMLHSDRAVVEEVLISKDGTTFLEQTSLSPPTNRSLSVINLLFYILPVAILSLSPFVLYRDLNALTHYFSPPETPGNNYYNPGNNYDSVPEPGNNYDNGTSVMDTGNNYDSGGHSVVAVIGVIFGCALLAFGLIIVELVLIKMTSSLTLSIIVVVKELVLIGCSIWIYGDDVTLLNGVGFTVCITGILLYAYHKRVTSDSSLVNGNLADVESPNDSGRREVTGRIRMDYHTLVGESDGELEDTDTSESDGERERRVRRERERERMWKKERERTSTDGAYVADDESDRRRSLSLSLSPPPTGTTTEALPLPLSTAEDSPNPTVNPHMVIAGFGNDYSSSAESHKSESDNESGLFSIAVTPVEHRVKREKFQQKVFTARQF